MRKYSCSVFIDLYKAFDTVDHNILFHKLEYYGIRRIALELFSPYLSNRRNFVSTNRTKSKHLNVVCPTEFSATPLLFILYIIFINNLKELESILNVEFNNVYQCTRGVPEVMMKAVISLYEDAKTRVRVGGKSCLRSLR